MLCFHFNSVENTLFFHFFSLTYGLFRSMLVLGSLGGSVGQASQGCEFKSHIGLCTEQEDNLKQERERDVSFKRLQNFPAIFQLLISNLIPLWSENIFCMI